MNLRTIKDIDVRGKYVLLRDDFNVQIVDGKITDAFRIEQSMPTINLLRNSGARVVIVAHRGRPRGVRDMSNSLRPIADYMGVQLIGDCLDKDFMSSMSDGNFDIGGLFSGESNDTSNKSGSVNGMMDMLKNMMSEEQQAMFSMFMNEGR